jgi:hypothetical protein
MCFSATASFVTGSILVGGGATSIKIAQKSAHIPFALIPVLFGLQQFSEGFLWLALENEGYANWELIFATAFLLFAQGIWPIWVPFAIWRLEKDEKRKKILAVFLIMGGIVSLYLTYCILSLPVSANIKGGHVAYVVEFPHTETYYLAVIYLIPILVSPLVSTVKWMKIIGILIAASFFITKYFFDGYVISVWCFFAAVISIGVLIIVQKSLKEGN